MPDPSPEPSRLDTTIRDRGEDTFGFLDRPAAGTTGDGREADAPSAPPPYVLRSQIGQGGQADVWEAWQTSLHRLVALKIHRRGTREEFLREALLTGELDHPNIVPVLDIGPSPAQGGGDRLAMAMKRIRGRRWDETIAEDRAAGAGDSLRRHLEILLGVCRAVSYAHARGIVHLDLKPGQVMVGEFGEVYLMDWGVAARLDAASPLPARHVAEISVASGTPAFMAPEQALGDGASIGIATDVYLLGALAYHAACGRAPHPGERTEEILEAAKRNEIVPPDAGVPETLRAIFMRAMRTTPGDRHSSAEEFRRDIDDFLAASRQRAEARALAMSVEAERERLGLLDYPELARLEQSIDRAEALAPGESATRSLRDDVLSAHHARALQGGDLQLARIVAERIGEQSRRAAALLAVEEAEARAAAREKQRRRARRISIVALSCAVAVLLGSSIVLRTSLATASAERERAEAALALSGRELARASVQAALSHVEHQREAEARESLKAAPAEYRGWEWGYLANAAVPEAKLLRPRGEVYGALATSADGTLVGAIRAVDSALVMLDPDAEEGAEPLLVDGRNWNVVAGGARGEVLAGSRDGEIVAFDAKGESFAVRPESTPIVALAPSGEESVLAADEAGRVWRVGRDGSGELLLRTSSAPTALSARGEGFAVGTADGEVRHTGELGREAVLSSFVHAAPVLGFAWHPGGERFVSWAATGGVAQPLEDSRAAVHAVGEAKPLFVREPDGLAITAATWAPSGDKLYLASAATTIFEHDAATWRRLRTLLHPAGIVRWMEYLPDGSHLATFTWRTAEVRSMADNVVPRSVRADSRAIAGRAIRGRELILCGSDGGIGAWRADRTEHERNFQIHRERGLTLDMAPEAKLLVSGHVTGKIMLWDGADPDRARVRESWIDRPVAQVRISADGSRLAAIDEAGTLHVAVGIGTEAERRRIVGAGETFRAATISADGRTIVAARTGGGLLRADFDSDATLEPFGDAGRGWAAVQMLGRNGRIAAGGVDGAIAILDERGDAILELHGHEGAVRRIAPVGDGALLSASDDETARLWNAIDGRCLAVYRGTHAGAVTSAVATPDGRRILTSCLDSVVRIFDRETAVEILALVEHQYGVLDMAMSPDASVLFTTGQDSRLRAWFALPPDLPDGVLASGAAKHRRPSSP